MNFLDEAVYNVKKGNMPPDPTTLDKDDVVNIGEKNLDPVGKEDDDINNDGKVNSTDKYLANKRKAIAKAILKSKKTIKKEDLEEGKLANVLGGAAMLASLLLVNKINSSDPVVQRLKAEYEQAEPAKQDSIQKLLTKRLIFLDTGKFDDSTPMREGLATALEKGINKFISGGEIDLASLLKGLDNLRPDDDLGAEELKLVKDTVDDLEKGKVPFKKDSNEEKEFFKALEDADLSDIKIKGTTNDKEKIEKIKKLIEAIRKKEASGGKKPKDDKPKEKPIKGAGGKPLVDPQGRPIMISTSKGNMKEAKDIKLPPDTVFKLDLKHLTKKHMEKGHSKEKAIEITKRLMKKLHNKGKIEVDGQEIKFIKEADVPMDIPMALPKPDAPDYLGDDGMDYEGGMAKSQMLKMKKYAVALCDMIEDESQLESWVQAKLTKASDYMSSVYHYLDYQRSKMDESTLNELEKQEFTFPNSPRVTMKTGMYPKDLTKSGAQATPAINFVMPSSSKYRSSDNILIHLSDTKFNNIDTLFNTLKKALGQANNLEKLRRDKLIQAINNPRFIKMASEMNESMINGKKVDLKSLEGEDNMFTYAEFMDGTKLTDDELDQLSDDSDALDTYFGPGGVGHIPRSDFM